MDEKLLGTAKSNILHVALDEIRNLTAMGFEWEKPIYETPDKNYSLKSEIRITAGGAVEIGTMHVLGMKYGEGTGNEGNYKVLDCYDGMFESAHMMQDKNQVFPNPKGLIPRDKDQTLVEAMFNLGSISILKGGDFVHYDSHFCDLIQTTINDKGKLDIDYRHVTGHKRMMFLTTANEKFSPEFVNPFGNPHALVNHRGGENDDAPDYQFVGFLAIPVGQEENMFNRYLMNLVSGEQSEIPVSFPHKE